MQATSFLQTWSLCDNFVSSAAQVGAGLVTYYIELYLSCSKNMNLENCFEGSKSLQGNASPLEVCL